MAPGRKRGGAKGAKTKSQLSLGDLVLAKVKGFPAWPAKISKPEDWERTPDPKKYFVQFFGTEEIAFVAPADIQAFTSESKNKLSARCKGKTVKYFSQAVKEICDAFEELQHRNSGAAKDGNDGQALESDTHSNEVMDDGMSTDGPGGETDLKENVNHGPGLERCTHIHGDSECEDIKPSVSPGANDDSSVAISSKNRNEHPCDDITSPKKEILSIPNTGDNRHLEAGMKAETNGQKSKKSVTDLKRKPEGNDGRQKIRSPAGVRSAGQKGLPESSENLKDGIRKRISSHGRNSLATVDALKPEVDGNSKKTKKVVNDKIRLGVADEFLKDAEGGSMEQNKVEVSGRKVKAEHGHGKDIMANNGVWHPAKRSKCSDDASKGSEMNKKSDVSSKGGNEELRRPTSRSKTENRLIPKGDMDGLDSGVPGDEDVLPPTKRRRRALEAMSGSTLMSEDKLSRTTISTKKGLTFDMIKSPVAQVPIKRRAVRLCDDDDEEEPKTPVHGGSAKKVDVVPHVSASVEKTAPQGEPAIQDPPGVRDLGVHELDSSKEFISSHKQLVDRCSPNPQQDITEIINEQVPSSPRKAESEKKSSKEARQVLASPCGSPFLVDASKPVVESLKANKPLGKFSGIVPQKKVQAGSSKGSGGVSDGGHLSQTHAVNERNKPVFTGERQKSTPKSSSRVTEPAVGLGKPSHSNLLSSERLEVGGVDRTNSLPDPRSKDEKSMKHLIAAAQAKRRLAQSQNLTHDSVSFSQFSAIEITVRSPSSASAVQPILPGSGIMVQSDLQGYYSQTSLASPSSRMHQFVSNNQPDPTELEETRVGSGHRPAGGSLSGGTEAAVARDAFEGMIETLSRTKESIGRATRLAIDCAKYGIANEVVELLIRKLENEPSFHRRVDLFFLVDSITQCSHSQKGIAGASYIPTVQAALPRLLGAAAPPGASARENRRQCLKVLRLWLERKILPDTLLRCYMDDIGASNDDTSAGFFPKRPSRSERAVDDPIREMEGMLVDEYGSNATFQLPGFLSSNVFEEEDEDDILNISNKETSARSPTEPNSASGEVETCSITPTDRRHCILEDVDGELEMEDVSGHPKDERLLLRDGSSNAVEEGSERILDTDSNNLNGLSPLCDGSPPLPLDSPPATPPLPSSPPPLPPSMLPPPPSSPSPAPPPPPPPPTPPPPPHTHPLHPPPTGPPQLVPQLSLPPQPQLPSQMSMPPQTSAAPQQMLPYQPPMPSNVAVNTRLGAHVDGAVRAEMFPQQSSCFLPAAACGTREPSGFNSSRSIEYVHETYQNSQSSQSNQQFQTGNIPLPQRTFQTPMLPQTAPGQFPYSKPAIPHPQHAYPPPYALTKPPDGLRRYGADEQWRPPSNEFNADNQRGAWMNGGRTSLSSGPPFGQEGYFRPPMERPPTNNVGFQSGMNVVPAGAPIPGHSGTLMMPGRPDMSSLNSWRPA